MGLFGRRKPKAIVLSDAESQIGEQATSVILLAIQPCLFVTDELTDKQRETLILFCFGITDAVLQMNRISDNEAGLRIMSATFAAALQLYRIDGRSALNWCLACQDFPEGRRVIQLGGQWATSAIRRVEPNPAPSLVSLLLAPQE